MLVILEGPDGAGKSTYAQSLVRQGFKLKHWGPVQDPWREYIGWLQSVRPGEDWVVDRFFPSERVYGQVLRGHDRLGANKRMLERVCLSLGAVVVLLDPGQAMIEYNVGQRTAAQDLPGVRERLAQLRSAYLHYDWGLPHRIMDYTHQEFFPDYLRTVASRPCPPFVVGNFKPGQVLLVGDSLNLRNAYGPWPFVSDRGCSPWLAQQLDDLGLPEDQLLWCNARVDWPGVDGPEMSGHWVHDVRPSEVVALGTRASRWCQRHGLRHAVAPHPAFWKRFHASRPYPLLDVLRRHAQIEF